MHDFYLMVLAVVAGVLLVKTLSRTTTSATLFPSRLKYETSFRDRFDG